MKIVALMPTYRRPRLAANALACFLAQTWPNKYLLICDDSGELPNQQGDGWEVLAVDRQPSLPAKYNLMARRAFEQLGADAVAVFEDDDVYLPDYLANHAAALKHSAWSHCSWAWTDGSGGPGPRKMQPERTGHARLHGCLAMHYRAFQMVGRWPATYRMDFDLQLLAGLNRLGPPGDPCQWGPSQYYFRWASTQSPHGQSFSTGPGDENWLAKAQAAIDARRGPVQPLAPLVPRFDAETQRLFESFTPAAAC